MLSAPIWQWHEVSLWSLFRSSDRLVLGGDLVGSRARSPLQAYKTVLRETLLLGWRQYNHDWKLNEARAFLCLPSWSHIADLATNVTRMGKTKRRTYVVLSRLCFQTFSLEIPHQSLFVSLLLRLQSFSGGLRAFSTLHQVLCYIW